MPAGPNQSASEGATRPPAVLQRNPRPAKLCFGRWRDGMKLAARRPRARASLWTRRPRSPPPPPPPPRPAAACPATDLPGHSPARVHRASLCSFRLHPPTPPQLAILAWPRPRRGREHSAGWLLCGRVAAWPRAPAHAPRSSPSIHAPRTRSSLQAPAAPRRHDRAPPVCAFGALVRARGALQRVCVCVDRKSVV